jgi:hypothetical protein
MTELFICMTQKLINLLNEDDTQKVEQMIQDFEGYNQNGIEVVMVKKGDSGGAIMMIRITSPTITDDIVNEKLEVISKDLQSKGYGDLILLFVVSAVYYTPEGVDLKIDVMNYQPHQIKNNLRYEYPSIQDILMGNVDFTIQSNVIPTVNQDTAEWIRIKKKRCMTVYQVLQKGSVNGVSYTLGPIHGMSEVEPTVTPNYKKTLQRDTINQLLLSVELNVRITEVSDLNRKDEVSYGIKEKFEKFGVNVEVMVN